MSNSISRDRERICKRAQEIGLGRFASDFGVEEPDSALVNTKAEFQKYHGRERCVYGKESGIAENAIWSRKFGGEIPDLAGRHFRESGWE